MVATMSGSIERSKTVVLIVEDEPLLQLAAVDSVEAAGFVCLCATNADHAIALMECRPDIRIVFTDVDIPGSMNGLALVAMIHRRWPPTILIVTSGHVGVRDDELPDDGRFFAKPYDHRVLVRTMHEMLA